MTVITRFLTTGPYGRYTNHGELAHARFNGTIPSEYKKGTIFFNKAPGSTHFNVIFHEIGHVLGLEHSASNVSVMYSGIMSRGMDIIRQLPEQDILNLQYLWDCDNESLQSLSGTIQTDHTHKIALVFAVNSYNGHTYSTRSDLNGRFTLVVGQPGRYKIVAKSVEVSDDIKSLKSENFVPQSASWYADDGFSTPDPSGALEINIFPGRMHTRGSLLQMIDTPAPFKLTKAYASTPDFNLKYLHPGDTVMISLPQVPNIETIRTYGSNPDYHFTPVPDTYIRLFNYALSGDQIKAAVQRPR